MRVERPEHRHHQARDGRRGEQRRQGVRERPAGEEGWKPVGGDPVFRVRPQQLPLLAVCGAGTARDRRHGVRPRRLDAGRDPVPGLREEPSLASQGRLRLVPRRDGALQRSALRRLPAAARVREGPGPGAAGARGAEPLRLRLSEERLRSQGAPDDPRLPGDARAARAVRRGVLLEARAMAGSGRQVHDAGGYLRRSAGWQGARRFALARGASVPERERSRRSAQGAAAAGAGGAARSAAGPSRGAAEADPGQRAGDLADRREARPDSATGRSAVEPAGHRARSGFQSASHPATRAVRRGNRGTLSQDSTGRAWTTN